MSNDNRLANFFFEAGFLQNMERTGLPYLGSGSQNVASHVYRTCIIGFTLASEVGADADKVLKMCLFHDIEEARTGDLNYLQQRYVDSDDDRALSHALKGLPIESSVKELIDEFTEQKTIEARLAKDADVLELILFLKEQADKGNDQAKRWIRAALTRLKTDRAKGMAEGILETLYYEWWYGEDDDWKGGSKNW
ncbi:HD domain-containing protein [Limisalsivibrio acetivorans]|uniref:HD domain-containing protein n=1 Tax=Limisalsivibrio acetivorans TaxID=1304888 RepID=UPI0003B4A5AD|nr:HD domain-containing protein [Limisalsivibrio acetivorans]